jgi:tetratricopeptide (TPR) repeat protein
MPRSVCQREDLADDLGRYLEQRPILARRTSVVARAWKWSKRRPTAAALIAVALLSAVGFLVGSQWYSTKLRRQRDVAESDYRQTMRTMEKVLADIDLEQLVYDPGQEQRRRPQVEAALGLYQQFLSHWAHDARLRTDTAHAYRKLGDIELWLGDHAKAQAAYGNAIKTYELLRSEDQDRPEYRRWQAYCWNFLGETHRRMSQPQDAESAYEKAIQLQKPLASEPSALADDHRELARSYYNLGILYRETNRADDAEKLLRQAIEFLEKLVQEHPRQPDYRQHLARAHINLGPILRASHRVTAAVDAYGRAIELLDKLAEEHADQSEYRFELAIAYVNRGNAFRTEKQLREAKSEYELAQQTLAKLVADNLHVPLFLQELANCENSLAAVLVTTDGPAAAEKEWLDACQRLRQLEARPNAPPAYRGDLGMTLGNLGWVYLRDGNTEKSRRYLQEGIDYLEKALQANPDHPDYQLSLRGQYRDLAESSLQLGDHAAAAAAAMRLAKIARGSPGDEFHAACLLIRSGSAADADARLPEGDRLQSAQRYFGQALALLRQLSQGGFADLKSLDQASSALAATLERNAELKEALAALRAKAREKGAGIMP